MCRLTHIRQCRAKSALRPGSYVHSNRDLPLSGRQDLVSSVQFQTDRALDCYTAIF